MTTRVIHPSVGGAWLDRRVAGGWLDENFLTVGGGAEFDPALMQAMDRPWRDIVFSKPKAVASGMTPPDSVPT